MHRLPTVWEPGRNHGHSPRDPEGGPRVNISKRVWSFVSLLVLLAGILVAVAAADRAAEPPGLAQAAAVKDQHAAGLFSHQGVVGVGVGDEDGEAAVIVFTTREGVAGIPASLDGVKVAVRVSGPISALVAAVKPPGAPGKGGGPSPTSVWPRPVPIGVSTGRADECAAGTIAARVKSGSTVYALSNNHVYANENDASRGDEVEQPGLYDTNCRYSSANDLGNLTKWTTIDFSGGENTMDAAIAQTDTATLGNATPPNGYGVPSSTTAPAQVNMSVEKYGRTTSLTQGTVCAIDFEGNIGYSSGTAYFVNQIVVCSNKGAFLKAGDSGSLLVTSDGNNTPVGLMFAGDSSGRYGFANPIDDVLSALGVSIDGS